MDSTSLNHYEERLYSVFKTFDVDNEEALSEAAVLALCDALQLEQRGAALVDTLFERRDQRVTFAQFRSGLLAVLADPPPSAPAPAAPPPPMPAEPPPVPVKPVSDDDSSGREVAPKFVFGSKRYGRRSRPSRARPSSSIPLATPQPPCETGAAAADLELDHSSCVDAERALQLCRRLHMDGIDRRLVGRVFESVPAGETTVGEFFDRLNSLLSSSVDGAVTVAEAAGALASTERVQDEDDALPTELVAEAWVAAGVQRARRLLAELGFSGAALHVAALDRALDEECGAQHEPAGHTLLLQAALALARLRRDRTARRAADVAAERDRLRADVDEANRRARILAQEVDENHARLEADLTASLRRAETKHAEALRGLEAERAAERERVAEERARLEEELARRVEAEQKLRAEADSQRARAERLEARVAEGEERLAAGERERARLAGELAATEARASGEAAEARREACELAAGAEELRAENARLRDRCDELCAQLDARPRAPAEPDAPHNWHEEASAALPLVTVPVKNLEGESPPVSLEPSTAEAGAGAGAGAGAEVELLRADLARAEEFHAEERLRFEELVKELETSLEALRVEYERCEEYWSGKLQQERGEGDARLQQLQTRLLHLQRQYALSAATTHLPAVPEQPALERQAQELDAAAADLARRDAALTERDAELARRDADLARREAELSTRRRELARRERDLARLAHGLHALRRAAGRGPGCEAGGGAVEAELRLRLSRAEAGAARLAARLASADLLVKELYVESCMLSAPPPPPPPPPRRPL